MAEESAPKQASILTRRSGIRTALRYTGIPPSWLDKRPKLPSRNWLIFLSVTSSVLGLYVYDRRQCKQIRQTYVNKVKHLAEDPVEPFDAPRKVTVYASKWPGDEDYDQSLKYFRKYVKPILVAAAIDYDMVAGKRHGDIAKQVADDVRIRRRFDLKLDKDSEATKLLPTYKSPSQRQTRELEGGIVIVGRPTFKEFMLGLKKGWTEGLEKVDRDELLARKLEDDTHFDEPEDLPDLADNTSAESQMQSKFPVPPVSPVFSPLQMKPPIPTPTTPPSSSDTPPPSVVPPLPPLLLVPFTDYIGFSQIPLMIWDFFNQRYKVRVGAEAGYRLVMKNTRPLQAPEHLGEIISTAVSEHSEYSSPPSLGDLNFDKQAESYFKKSLRSLPAEIEKARTKYYEALPAKLAIARALARGTREPSKEEITNPPPTEVELRAERLKKERRWREDLEGWEIIKPSSQVAWDERFRDSLQIFIDPADEGDLSDTMS